MRHFRTATAAAALLVGLTSTAKAQTCTGNPCTVQVTASATVSDILRLTLSSTTANLGNPVKPTTMLATWMRPARRRR